MVRFVVAQLRHRVGRALALLAGVAVATAAFSVLTGASRSGRLDVQGEVAADFRRQYDILVRPTGTRDGLERRDGVVRPNVLSGIFGGITDSQYRQVAGLAGVDVAAPVAMVRYVLPTTTANFDLTPALSGAPRQVLRLDVATVADRGLTRIPNPPLFSYVTSSALEFVTIERAGTQRVREVGDGGRRVAGCEWRASDDLVERSVFSVVPGPRTYCWSRVNAGWLTGWDGVPRGGAGVPVTWSLPLLVAAIDPEAEARLSGLDRAVVSGRYLRASDTGGVANGDGRQVPFLVASSTGLDTSLEIRVSDLGRAGEDAVSAGRRAYPELQRLQGPQVWATRLSADELLARLDLTGRKYNSVASAWKPGPVTYQASEMALRPRPTRNDAVFADDAAFGETIPYDNADQQFRSLSERFVNSPNAIFPRRVGVFDVRRLAGFGEASELPLGAFFTSGAAPGDANAAKLLGGRELLPSANMGGYLTQAPQLITTLDAVRQFAQADVLEGKDASAPISIIRVRVAGVTGPDAVSRERVRSVAQRIGENTGLDVDIVTGSSPAPRQTVVPAGAFGRPELVVQEGWVRKGVAVTILNAIDRKSLTLFVLVLVVCSLFVANAAAAAVRARRTELGVLACLGWPARRLFGLILIEIGALGFVAGTIGALLALPLGRLLGIDVSPTRAAIAIPAAALLAILAGLSPAWRAARSDPADAVRPAVTNARRAASPTSITGLAATNVLRTPGRSLLGAASLAVGVTALTLLVAVTWAFRGAVVGSLLGEAVSVQIRTVDYIAVITTVALGGLAIADVLYLNVRERSAELATLQATGWTDTALTRLIVTEGTLIGLAGALTGATVGLIGALAFTDQLPLTLIATTIAVVTIATALAAAASALPTLLLRRLPTARLLAEE